MFVPYAELPSDFINALIAIEDANFFTHKGIDPKGIARALMARVKSEKFSQGASTITQQLVRNTILHNEKTLERKIVEIAWALEVEKRLNKEKILEIYANIMFLGNGAYGVGAAAHRYFGKPLQSSQIPGSRQKKATASDRRHEKELNDYRCRIQEDGAGKISLQRIQICQHPAGILVC